MRITRYSITAILGAVVCVAIVHAAPAAAATYVVNNTSDSGQGSLRAAINFANATPGTIIKFHIPLAQGADIDAGQSGGDAAADVFVIQPGAVLPTLTADGTQVDGSTQAVFLGSDTNPRGPEIVIDGSNVGVVDGLRISAANCQVKKLVITNYAAGVWITDPTAHHNSVTGCYLGVDASGAVAQGNTRGVQIEDGAHDNTVGGTTAAARNVIIGVGNEGAAVQIRHAGSDNNRVQGNYIGTDRTGTAVLGTGFFGILINAGPQHNLVGGTVAGARNVIAAQSENTLGITFSDNNIVQGNYIGTDVTGTVALGSASYGVALYACSGNKVGGAVAAARNVISGNQRYGDLLLSEPNVPDTTNNSVQGNYIGTNAAGTTAVGNQIAGVGITGAVYDNVIGVALDGTGAGNRIAFNTGDGVRVFFFPGDALPTRNTIRRNSIYNNGGLGINLQPEGETANTFTPNDPGDGDGGPNNLQNFPVLNSVIVDSSTTVIKGFLNSTPGTSFKIDFYRSPTADASGYGAGKFFIGSITVNTNGNGNALINVSLPVVVPAGQRITATATNRSTGDTSEFSRARAAVAASSTTASSTTVASTPSASGVRLSFTSIDTYKLR